MAEKISPVITAATMAADTRISREERLRLLDPNYDYDVREVGEYNLSMGVHEVVIGYPETFNMVVQPPTTFRPRRILMNVPDPNLFFVEQMKVSNLSAFIGEHDAYLYRPNPNGSEPIELDMPTVNYAQKITARVRYTGEAPSSYNECGIHDDCRQHLELASTCAAERKRLRLLGKFGFSIVFNGLTRIA
jgi:hypothetical protein